ncbi:MAG: hypothetical protein V7K53_26725 [Nostoc sp.]
MGENLISTYISLEMLATSYLLRVTLGAQGFAPLRRDIFLTGSP